MKYDFVVIGATGIQGRIVTKDLIKSGYTVLMVGRDKSRVLNLLKEFSRKTAFEHADVHDQNKVIKIIKSSGSKIVINCVEGDWNLVILNECIEADVNSIDLGSDIPMTKKQLVMGRQMREKMDLGLLALDESSNPEAVKVAYYYDVVDRVDELTSSDMDGPFSAVRIRWGDQYIVPQEYAFYSFAVARVMRTGENLQNVIEELMEKMKEDALDVNGENYGIRRTTQSWQNLNGRDILAVFNKDLEIATKQGKERVGLLNKVYSGLDSLERILIPGPNGTSLYVLSTPENYDLFDRQLRKTVEERIPVLEGISIEREKMTKRMVSIEKKVLKIFGEDEHYVSSMIPLNEGVRSELSRMINWLAEGEHPLDLIPF